MTNYDDTILSVISTVTNKVVDTISTGPGPFGLVILKTITASEALVEGLKRSRVKIQRGLLH